MLSFHKSCKIYNPDEIGLIYTDIQAFCDAEEQKKIQEAAKKGKTRQPQTIDPEKFSKVVAKNSGTHLLKSRKSDFGGSEVVLRLAAPGQNSMEDFLPSINAGDMVYAKILYRPIEIEGHARVASLIDHLLQQDDYSPAIFDAFTAVYGKDVLADIRDEICAPAGFVRDLPAKNLATVFVPAFDGDVQITPVHPARAFLHMQRIRASFFVRKTEDDDAPRRFGTFSLQAVSSKIQNISGAYAGERVRFHAEFPNVMTMDQAQIYRFAMGGRQPSIIEDGIADRFESYISLMETWSTYHSPQIKASLDRLAKSMIRIALEIAQDIGDEARRLNPDFDGSINIPDLILSTMRFEKNEKGNVLRSKARAVLKDIHFRKILESLT